MNIEMKKKKLVLEKFTDTGEVRVTQTVNMAHPDPGDFLTDVEVRGWINNPRVTVVIKNGGSRKYV